MNVVGYLSPIYCIAKYTEEQLLAFRYKFINYVKKRAFINLPIEERKNRIKDRIVNHIGFSGDDYLDFLQKARPELYVRLLEKVVLAEKKEVNTNDRVFAPIIINQIPSGEAKSIQSPLTIENQPRYSANENNNFPALVSSDKL